VDFGPAMSMLWVVATWTSRNVYVLPNLERDSPLKKIEKLLHKFVQSSSLETGTTLPCFVLSTMSGHLIASTSARISLFSSARRHATVTRWSRHLHVRRPLGYPIEDGLGAFLPPPALKMLAVDYQDGLLQRLNDEVQGMYSLHLCCPADVTGPLNTTGTAEETKSVAQTVIDTAQERSKSLAFRYASEALNNSFFLDFLVRLLLLLHLHLIRTRFSRNRLHPHRL
jgi:hypothetical protein